MNERSSNSTISTESAKAESPRREPVADDRFDLQPGRSKIGLWFRLATSGQVVRRALFYALVVGLVLNSINHGPTMLQGEITEQCYVQMFLTACVPYVVSTLSSVQAMLQKCQR